MDELRRWFQTSRIQTIILIHRTGKIDDNSSDINEPNDEKFDTSLHATGLWEKDRRNL